jgi:YbgC/YbaW family acyl-CoA thioester hydrolase
MTAKVVGLDEYWTHVELADTDAFGVIFWGSAVRWSQRGYENLARSAGFPIETMLSMDHDHPVVNVNFRFFRGLYLGNRIRVQTDIARVGNRSFDARCRVFTPEDELAIEAICTHVAASRNRGPSELEDWVRALAAASPVRTPSQGETRAITPVLARVEASE